MKLIPQPDNQSTSTIDRLIHTRDIHILCVDVAISLSYELLNYVFVQQAYTAAY